MFVYGVNHAKYAGEKIISNASARRTASLRREGLERHVGISALMTTVHAATATQKTVDARRTRTGARRASSRTSSVVDRRRESRRQGHPDSTRSSRAWRSACDVRVSVVDLTSSSASRQVEEICAAMKAASTGAMKGVLGYTDEKSSRPTSAARAARRCSMPRPVSRSTTRSSRSSRGTTTMGLFEQGARMARVIAK